MLKLLAVDLAAGRKWCFIFNFNGGPDIGEAAITETLRVI